MVYEPPRHVFILLEDMTRRLSREMTARMEGGAVVRGSEARILTMLGEDGARPTDLAKGAWISKQAIGKRVRELEERGLVETRPDPDDGRAVRVHRTEAGDRALAFTVVTVGGLERDLAREVGPDRYRTFLEVMEEIGRG